MTRAREIPPGVHIRASLSLGEAPRQLRILGDDQRGYLVAGIPDVLAGDGEEFWYPTLDEALACGERVGVPKDAWTEIKDVSEAQMR